MLPKLHPVRIVGVDEDVAFADAQDAEPRQTGIDELPADTTTATTFRHCQMMQIAASAVMTAQHRADDLPIPFCYEAQARISPQIHSDGTARIGFVQSHTFGASPQCKDRPVIIDAKRADGRVTNATAGFVCLHSTVTLLARLRGLSTSQPRATAMW